MLNKVLGGVGLVLGALALFFRGRFKSAQAARVEDQLKSQERQLNKQTKAKNAVLDGLRKQDKEVRSVQNKPADRNAFSKSDY